MASAWNNPHAGEIGPLPAVVDPARREACRRDFQLFCETYLAETFRCPWSPLHLQLLLQIEDIVLAGGLQAEEVPAGIGASSLCDAAVVWSLCYGHHKYVILVRGGRDFDPGEELEPIKRQFIWNEQLRQDFPEICHPLWMFWKSQLLADTQHVNGIPTATRWFGKELRFPTVEGSCSSGAVLVCGGLHNRTFHGTGRRLPGGAFVRPTLIILDNPRPAPSGDSFLDDLQGEWVISKTVPKVAGPQQKLSVFMPCVVNRPGDLAARMCDPQRHPAWR